jgi:hypothetical protein
MNQHAYIVKRHGALVVAKDCWTARSLSGARKAARLRAARTGEVWYLEHGHTYRREYYAPDGTRLPGEPDPVVDHPVRWCDTCESKIIDIAGDTTCWRCQQKATTAERASDLIHDGIGLRARGGLVYFG